MEHDVIILSTDGMSDNLWDEDVIEQLSRLAAPIANAPQVDHSHHFGTGGSPAFPSTLRTALLPTTLSYSLCTRARSVSENAPSTWSGGIESPDTPFSRRAKEEGIDFVGGKPDGKLKVFFFCLHQIWKFGVTWLVTVA
jgi:protein phosphatase PTC7